MQQTKVIVKKESIGDVLVVRKKRQPWSTRQSNLHVVAGIHLDPHAINLFQNLVEHIPIAYEKVALPCSTMKCGDIIYRSTLDPALRMESKGIDPRGVALLGVVLAYLTSTPGVLQGFWDIYIVSTFQRKFGLKAFTKDDIRMGKKLATGGFGTVYKGEIQDDDGSSRQVIVKKANEFGEAEVWMNERLSRACPDTCAEFIAAFEDNVASSLSLGPLWLVWQYEGDFTLFDLMQKKDFPYNMEEPLFGQELALEKGPARKQIIISQILQQILSNLRNCHRIGIVHRDMKPQNLIFSKESRTVKLIDLGAAADLRTGINYIPNEFLLDPRYAPPQNYIMSTQIPRAPPAPIAALLSPILWILGAPDRFDMYSVGMIVLQMVFPPLRNDNILIAFRRKLDDFDYDIQKWREFMEKKSSRDYKEGFELLDMYDGAGWELLCELLQPEPEDRPSAASAINHRFVVGNSALSAIGSLGMISRGVTKSLSNTSIAEGLQGTQKRQGGLTEAELSQSLGFADPAPKTRRMLTTTMAWWQERQADFNRQADQRKKNLGKDLYKIKSKANQTIRDSQDDFQLFGWFSNKGSEAESK